MLRLDRNTEGITIPATKDEYISALEEAANDGALTATEAIVTRMQMLADAIRRGDGGTGFNKEESNAAFRTLLSLAITLTLEAPYLYSDRSEEEIAAHGKELLSNVGIPEETAAAMSRVVGGFKKVDPFSGGVMLDRETKEC